MSVLALNWAFQQPLNGNEKVVLLALADWARDDGLCWPGQESVAEKCYLSVRAVRDILHRLEEKGYIGREERRRENGSKTSDLIRLRLAAASAGDDLSAAADLRDGHRQPAAGPEPSEEPSGLPLSADAPSGRRRPGVKCNGRPVPRPLVEKAERLLDEYCSATDRRLRAYTGGGAPSEDLKRIISRLVDYPDLDVAELAGRMRAFVQSPPDWIEGKPVVGQMFGPRAFSHLLARAPARKPGEGPVNKITEALRAAQ